MRFELTETQQAIRDEVRKFATDQVAPGAAARDAAAEFPAEIVAKMGELGFMGVSLPEEWGGAGMDYLCYAITVEEFSRACASTGVILSAHHTLFCTPILEFGTDQQKERWLRPAASGEILGCYGLSEPGSGSDAAGMVTTAVRDGDEWVLNGAKNFITNASHSAASVIFTISDRAAGHKGITAFIVPLDTPGVTVGEHDDKLGIKAAWSSPIYMENVRLPADAMLGEEGEGFTVAMKTLDTGRIGIGAQAVGIATAAYEQARRYSTEREAFGRPISGFQAIQFMLADMATEIDASRLLVHSAAWRKDEGLRFGKQSAMAKLYASEMSGRVTDKALQVHGGYGYITDFPAERHLRDARITQIYEGTSEIQRLVIAREVLREYAS